MSKPGVNEEGMEYLKEKNIAFVVDYIVSELVRAKPEKPLHFISELTSHPIPPRILIIGPPAGGKGTQCEKIKSTFNVVHVSTGELLRNEVKKESALGKSAEQYMKSGQLVPDSLIIDIVRNRLSRHDCVQNGWLLDGFPRTREQALALSNLGIVPSCVLILDVPDEVLIERVEGRRTDPQTGKVYHLKFNPPPEDPEIMARLETRADDTREALGPRLQIYHQNLQSLEELYGDLIHHVNGNQSQEAIFTPIQKIVNKKHSF